jgi:hypothetical protein
MLVNALVLESVWLLVKALGQELALGKEPGKESVLEYMLVMVWVVSLEEV